MKKPVNDGLFHGVRGAHRIADGQALSPLPAQAAANQYPALKGLLIRNARGDTSTNLSVGIFSAVGSTGAISMPATDVLPSGASFARSAWLVCAERATEKNRST